MEETEYYTLYSDIQYYSKSRDSMESKHLF